MPVFMYVSYSTAKELFSRRYIWKNSYGSLVEAAIDKVVKARFKKDPYLFGWGVGFVEDDELDKGVYPIEIGLEHSFPYKRRKEEKVDIGPNTTLEICAENFITLDGKTKVKCIELTYWDKVSNIPFGRVYLAPAKVIKKVEKYHVENSTE